MTRYIAFLRGVNVSGKNKIPMDELKTAFENAGFQSVKTVLNSGNIAFDSDENDVKTVRLKTEKLIQDTFDALIPVFVISQKELCNITENAPDWWGTDDRAVYDNLIFILSDDTASAISDEIGEVSEKMEKTYIYNNCIYWSFDRMHYQKCNWWKNTAKNGIAQKLTIRTANTVKKMCRT